LRKQTGDDGKDLICFDARQGQFIVEVKRYSEERRVDVSIVRELLGVMVHDQLKGTPTARRAILVTSSGFTQVAVEFMQDLNKEGLWTFDYRDYNDVLDWLRLLHETHFDIEKLDRNINDITEGTFNFPRGALPR
jgi:hypothetical protein